MNNRPRPSAQFIIFTRAKKWIRFGWAAFWKSTPKGPSPNAPPLPTTGAQGIARRDVGPRVIPGRRAHGCARDGGPRWKWDGVSRASPGREARGEPGPGGWDTDGPPSDEGARGASSGRRDTRPARDGETRAPSRTGGHAGVATGGVATGPPLWRVGGRGCRRTGAGDKPEQRVTEPLL